MNAPVKYRIKGTKVYVEPVKARAEAASVPYYAASISKRLANWKINTGGPNQTIGGSLGMVRARARDVARKDGTADTGLEVLVNNIIGTGIKPQFNTPDSALNKQLAQLWLEWTDVADADNRFDFYGLQGLAVRSMLEAGDMFVRLRTRRKEDGLKVPLQLQLLESEFCPVEKNEVLDSSTVRHGIEFDLIGRRIFYWLYRDHPLDGVMNRNNNSMPFRVPANEVIQLASIKRPGQIRGEPWLVRALIKLHDLDEYDDAQLLRQKISTMFAGFLSPNAEGKMGWEEEGDPEEGVKLASLEPGTLQVLDPGAEMKFTEPPSAGDSYEAFMKIQNRYIATSIGVLYEQLTGDFSQVNDRTWRAAMNEFKRKLQRLQHSTVVFQFCRPILRRWLDYAVMNGAVKLPDGITIEQVAMPKWIPQAHEYINPKQDVEARRDEVRSGFTSKAQIVSERGYDAETIDQEIAADNKRADDLDLRFDSDGRTDLKGGAPAEDVEPEEPEDDTELRTAVRASIMDGLNSNG